MHLSIRTLNIACLAGFLALAIGGSFVTARAAKAKTARIDRDNKTVESLRREFNKAQAALDRLDGVLKANRTTLETLRKGLSGPEPIGGFLADLDALAGKAEVKVTAVSPGQGVPEEFCTRTPLAFSCQGSFAGLHAMLHGLERTERFVRVAQVSIGRSSLSSSCAMEITCSLYGR